MELKLIRKQFGELATIGNLFVDSAYQCFILEDKVREVPGQPVSAWKVQNQTAIPRGRYRLEIVFSPHFQRMMPHLIDVPGYTGVLIHWGNTAADTEGCILLGNSRATDAVTDSRAAWAAFFKGFDAACRHAEHCTLTIENDINAAGYAALVDPTSAANLAT